MGLGGFLMVGYREVSIFLFSKRGSLGFLCGWVEGGAEKTVIVWLSSIIMQKDSAWRLCLYRQLIVSLKLENTDVALLPYLLT